MEDATEKNNSNNKKQLVIDTEKCCVKAKQAGVPAYQSLITI